MSIYQRYLSKSLIFFSSFFVILFLFIETNIGFKCLFNLTSHFFLEFQVEEISGNWRDFRLKNVQYENSQVSIRSNYIHVKVDVKSLFHISNIFKKIESDNLIILLKKENIFTRSIIQKKSNNFFKKNIFIQYPIIFQKIHINKILLKMFNTNVFLSNVFTGIKLINNNIIFFPTHINTINIGLSNITLKKKIKEDSLYSINSILHMIKKNNFFNFSSMQSNVFIPFNINFFLVKCKSVNFLNSNIHDSFSVELRAKIKNNILKINKLKISSTFLNIMSYGKIIFHDNIIICNIKNKIWLPNLYNKIINFSFVSYLNNKFTFRLKFHNFYKTNISGVVFLNDLHHRFQIRLTSNNLFFSLKKTLIFKIKKLRAIIRGEINNYSISLQQILKVCGMPSIFIDIHGNGNLKDIFFKKIRCFLSKEKKYKEKKIYAEKNVIFHPSILKLIGKINLIGKSKNKDYNLYIPKIRIDGNMMKKKLSILGSLSYKNFNILESPGINFLLGRNKLYLKGVMGKKTNIYSSIHANNLDYFSPNLTGRIESKSNLYRNDVFSRMTNKILINNIKWRDIYLKSIKIFTNINTENKFLGNFLFDMKKAQFSNFYIDSLHIQVDFNKRNQKFHLMLKSPLVSINVILNGIINDKTGNWYGFLKKINVQTAWGKLINQKVLFSYDYHFNNKINNLYEKKIKIVNFFSNAVKNSKKTIFNIFNESLIDFKSELFIQAKLKSILGKSISYGNVLLTGNNIKLERKNKEKTFLENIDNLNLSLNLRDNNFKSIWTIKKSINFLKKQNISGQLNISDLYNQKNISGGCFITDFPISFINFFTENFKEAKGVFNGKIKFFGSLSRPEISANIGLDDIFIKSDNLLKYLTLFFPYFLGKIDNVKINQEISMSKGNLSLTLNKNSNHLDHIEWNLLFYSKKIEAVVLRKIKIKFSSQFNLHYLFEKYDLIGYIKFALFCFKINEKNFII